MYFSDDICILSASGTAAVLCVSDHDPSNMGNTPILAMSLQPRPSVVTTAVSADHDKLKEVVKEKDKPLKVDINLANQAKHMHDW